MFRKINRKIFYLKLKKIMNNLPKFRDDLNKITTRTQMILF